MAKTELKIVVEAGVWFIAIGYGCWGRGTTEAEALKQFKKAGGSTRGRVLIYRNDKPELTPEQVAACEAEETTSLPWVDGMGSIAYFGTLVKVVEMKNGKRVELQPT